MLKIILKLLDWLYLKKCYCCQKAAETSLCPKCFSSIEILRPIPIKIIKNTKIYSSTVYKDKIKKILRAIKYHQKQDFSNELAAVMYKFWKNVEDKKDFYEVIPTPSFRTRLKKRKYDHIKLICDDFAKMTNYKVNGKLLKRIKETKPQYKLSLRQREENLKDAFSCDRTYYAGGSVLLIDDICTTGATISEMIKTLHAAGISDITVLCCSCNESYIKILEKPFFR